MDTTDSAVSAEKVLFYKGGTVEPAGRPTPSKAPVDVERKTLPERSRATPAARVELPDRPAEFVPGTAASKSDRQSHERPAGHQSAGEPAAATSSWRPEEKAERAAIVERLQAELQERYVIKRAPVTVSDLTVGRTEYRFRGNSDRLAFTESTFKLATDSNSPFVARSMVDVAETRNWKALHVTGHEEFRRRVWFEAALRGVKTIGYEPMPSDTAWLRSEREARLVNRIEPGHDAEEKAGAPAAATATQRISERGGGGRKAVLAAVEAVLVAKGVPEKQREAVLAAATEKLSQRICDGKTPLVKVYDKAAPSQRHVAMPVPEVQRTRERAAPVR